MKTGSLRSLFVLLCLSLALFACSPGAQDQEPATDAPTPESIRATATPIPPVPTDTPEAPVVTELSGAEILQIARSSFAAYPWRMSEQSQVKSSEDTGTFLTEAQSGTRGYSQEVYTSVAFNNTNSVEFIVFDDTYYLKASLVGASNYGIVPDQWVEVEADSPLMEEVDAREFDPGSIAERFSRQYTVITAEENFDEIVFTLVGSEEVNGASTNLYEFKNDDFTYRWWIGLDGRLYKWTYDLSDLTWMTLVEYDPDINIQPPIP